MENIILILGITGVFLIVMIILAVLLLKNLRSISGQTKYLRQNEEEEKTCVYFPLDLNPSVLIAFKKACAQNCTSHTEEVERFIVNYCKEHTTDAPKDSF